MTHPPPDVFLKVQSEARDRWDNLENVPKLAGPWWQLFRQVKSPRHVVSELLQNADDAGASLASFRVDDGVFVFEHDGEDFDEASLQSLCEFAWSNKKTLTTIGFRGVGFKSVFSLGDKVEVRSPSLSFAFHENRFSEPIWLGDHDPGSPLTSIRVPLRDQHVEAEIRRNIERWAETPIPLLFFRSLTALTAQATKVTRHILGDGPVAGSRWVEIPPHHDRTFLVLESELLDLPEAAWQEIVDERQLPTDETERVPARVVLVVGEDDPGIYVTLPTSLKPGLPFSINAPFIQDPARRSIKSPGQSPTNRWLLATAGELASRGLIDWLGNEGLSERKRAEAYDHLLPAPMPVGLDPEEEDSWSLVTEAFRKTSQEKPILLGRSGALHPKGHCVALDHALSEVWTEEELLRIWGVGHRGVLEPQTSGLALGYLVGWELIDRVESAEILGGLKEKDIVRPAGLDQLAALWAYVDSKMPEPKWSWERRELEKEIRSLKLFPSVSDDELHPTEGLLLPSHKESLSEEDLAFLGELIPTGDRDWIEWLRSRCENADGADLVISGACSLWERLRKQSASELDALLDQACRRIFYDSEDPGDSGIRIAFIVARAGQAAPWPMLYLTEPGVWESPRLGVFEEPDRLRGLIPEARLPEHALSSRYGAALPRDHRSLWAKWLQSPRSGIRGFFLPEDRTYRVYDRRSVIEEIRTRGGQPPSDFPLKGNSFSIEDFDFERDITEGESTPWEYWASVATEDEDLWCRLAEAILADWRIDEGAPWSERAFATIRQCGYTREHRISAGKPVASWVLHLRGVPCLRDVNGRAARPAELIRMNPRTAHLREVERVLHPDLDRPENDEFLELLGVRTDPQSLDAIVERLRALSGTKAPSEEVHRLYGIVDRTFPYLQVEAQAAAKEAFRSHPLIRDEKGGWHQSHRVFLENRLGLPGLPEVPAPVRGLEVWKSLGVPQEPDLAAAKSFLETIELGASVPERIRPAVKALLAMFPSEVWRELRVWMAGDGSWRSIEEFQYWTAERSILKPLLQPFLVRTADMSGVGGMDEDPQRLTGLPDLSAVLDLRPRFREQVSRSPSADGWLRPLGDMISRVAPDPRNPVERVKARVEFGRELSRSDLKVVQELEAEPFIDGVPAGYPHPRSVVWHDGTLLCEETTGASLHSHLMRLIAPRLETPRLRQAVAACIERDPAWIVDYFAANFELIPVQQDSQGSEPDSEHERLADGEGPGAVTDDAGDQFITGAAEASPDAETELQDGEPEEEVPDDLESDVRPDRSRRKKRESKGPRPEEAHLQSLGFQRSDGENPERWVNPRTGDTIERDRGSPWWIHTDQAGEEIRRFAFIVGKLSKGVELPYEVVESLRRGEPPARLVIQDDSDREPRVLTRREFHELIRSGRLKVHPSTYVIREDPADN